MRELGVETDPRAVGLDAARLDRIGRLLDGYVGDGRLAGCSVLVARRGKIAYLRHVGSADREAGRAVDDDTLWRIYSMTKPITSVAAMSLFEEGAFELNDPVSAFLPEFADTRVWTGGTAADPQTETVTSPMRMWQLLSHTAGLTYGFMYAHPVDQMYRDAGFELGRPDMTVADACRQWAGMPLLFQPGTSWGYSVATDVLGRVLEVVAGDPLDRVLADRVLDPLGMTDTAWWADGDSAGRLAALYVRNPADGTALRMDRLGDEARHAPTFLSGGGGLVSTVADYHRFCEMLLGGGAFGGTRVLGPRTLSFMTRNHLPGGRELAEFGSGQFSEVRYAGVGFGLGFAVSTDPVKSEVLTGVGEFSWGGAASTAFFVDPAEDLSVVFMTQLLPSSTYPLRSQLRALVYQAIEE